MKNLNSFCFLAIEEGMRESTQNWREVFLKLKSRGMNEPELVIGDFTMGFLAALKTSIPRQGQQSSWIHKTMNVLNCLPKLPRRRPKIHCTTSGKQRQKLMLKKPSICSSKCMSQNIRRILSVCRKTVTKCWLSMTFRRSTGRVYGPAIRLGRLSAKSTTASNVQKGACHVMACCT